MKPTYAIRKEISHDGKNTFHSREAAEKEIQKMRSKGKAYANWIDPYKCRFCDYWHIGHPPGYSFQGEKT